MKRFLLFFLTGTFIAASGFAQVDLQPAAVVRLSLQTTAKTITVRQLKAEAEKKVRLQLSQTLGREPTAAELTTAVQGLNAANRKEVLDGMIAEELVVQAAEAAKITVTDSELDQQLKEMKNQVAQSIGRQPTDLEFAQAVLSQTGVNVSDRAFLRRQLLMQKYIALQRPSIEKLVKAPTDAEVLNQYNLYETNFSRPRTVKLSMIMVPFGDTAADRTRAEALAKRLKQEIGDNAAKFDEAAQKAPVPGSGYQFGADYLPRTPQAQQAFGEDFINAAFNLEQGKPSQVVSGPRGYYILKVTETYTAKMLTLDDIAQLGSSGTVRDYIKYMLNLQRQQEAINKLIEDLRKGAVVTVNENNLNW